jgi:hypothetical protein
MTKTNKSSTDRAYRLPISDIRRNLFDAMRSTYKNWERMTSLKIVETDDAVEQQIHIILSLIIDHIFSAGQTEDTSKDCKIIRYITIPWLNSSNEVVVNEQNISFYNDHIEIKKETLQRYSGKEEILNSLYPRSLDEKNPELLIWLPNANPTREIVLFMQFSLTGWIIDLEIYSQIIKPYLEIILNILIASEYLNTKATFYSIAKKRIPNLELANISEQLIYHEAWNSGFCQIVTDNDAWLGWQLSENLPELNSDEHDYLVATYLTSLMYTAKQGNEEAKLRLKKTLSDLFEAEEGAPLQIRISRGPAIRIGSVMIRTRCVVAQALTFLPHILDRDEYAENVNNVYSQATRILDDIETSSKENL